VAIENSMRAMNGPTLVRVPEQNYELYLEDLAFYLQLTIARR
jgi:hypothetical protein